MAKAKKTMKAKKAKKTKKTLKTRKTSSASKKNLKKKSVKKLSSKQKAKKVLAVPKGYHSITPYLIADNAAAAIEFYKKIFGAKEMMRMAKPNGRVGHAELKIGDAKIMISDECSEMSIRGPRALGGTAIIIHFYTKNVDSIVEKAVSAGAKLLRPVEDMFYGDRSGMLEDPFGHQWCVSTHIEDVTPAKMKKRMAELSDKYKS